jgi:serine phosphatase RsbU (regulator of sigma subunit)/Tfp pilus assembly protein PilF
MKKQILILLIFLTSSTPFLANNKDFQEKSDQIELANSLLEKSVELTQSNLDSALVLAYRAEVISKVLNNPDLTMRVLHQLGYVYYNQNNFDKAIGYFESSLNMARELDNGDMEAIALNRLGNTNQLKTNYLVALDYYLEALNINKRIQNQAEVARTLVNLANVYSVIGQYQRSIEHFLEALDIHESIGEREGLAWASLGIARLFKRLDHLDKAMQYTESALGYYREIEHSTGKGIGVTLCLNELGSIYHKMGDFNKAWEFTQQVLEINTRNGNIHGQASNHLSLGIISMEKGNLQMARNHLNKALLIKEQVGDSLDLSSLYRYLGEVEMRSTNYSKALNYLTQSLLFSEKHRLIPEISEAYRILSQVHSLMGQYRKALDTHINHALYKDSLNSSDISRLEMQYEFEKREKEQELLARQREALQQVRLERQRVVIVFFVVAFLLAGSLAAFIFLGYREKKRINLLLVAQNNEITRQKLEIESQKEEIEQQRDFVTRQRDQIAEQQRLITDSITYASRIQNAVLPSESRLKSLPWESFVFYKPKNIVSGDFFWVSEISKDKILIAVADCTGHGVPGAFMSMLGITLLREIAGKTKHLSPAEMLMELRRMVIISLNQQAGQVDQADGMDMAITIINTQTLEMEYAGAYLPVLITRKEKELLHTDVQNPPLTMKDGYALYELKGDKMPIGYHVLVNKPFTNHITQLQPNDSIYLFSDGYIDQFGGPKNTKFLLNNFKELLLRIQDETFETQKSILSKSIADYQGDKKQVDDMLILGVKINGIKLSER